MNFKKKVLKEKNKYQILFKFFLMKFIRWRKISKKKNEPF